MSQKGLHTIKENHSKEVDEEFKLKMVLKILVHTTSPFFIVSNNNCERERLKILHTTKIPFFIVSNIEISSSQ